MRFTSTQSGRTAFADIDYAPFGESSNTSAELNFTGQRQDTISGLYDFLFREYSPVQGRWISPDRAGFAAVQTANPETWNRYAYASNSPLNTRDFLGLESCDFSGDMCPCEGDTVVSIGVFGTECASSGDGEDGPYHANGRGVGGGGGGRGGASGKKLFDCIKLKFGLILLSFTPTIGNGENVPGNTNGSATLLFFNYGGSSAPSVGTITNDISQGWRSVPATSNIYDNPNIGATYNSNNFSSIPGWTYSSNPWTNYTVNATVGQAAVDTQIFELGNSIADILGIAPPHEHDPSDDPGNLLLTCYQQANGTSGQ